MERPIPRSGEKYIHFKKKPYQIICVANHSETREKMVVYQALYGDYSCYVRPLAMFMGEVDHEKYPDVTQRYCFESVDSIRQDAPEDPAAKSLEISRHQIEVLNLDDESETLEEKLREEPGEETGEETDEREQADPALLAFLDADTLEEKCEVLVGLRGRITDRLIDDFAVTLDVVIPEGKTAVRYQQLLTSIRTMQRYENDRLRS